LIRAVGISDLDTNHSQSGHYEILSEPGSKENMQTQQEEKKFSSRQLRYLRGLGHHLKPLLMLGREGVTDNVISAANAVLSAHELVKVKIGNGCPLERREAAAVIAAKTGSEIVQVLGRTFLIFRNNPDRHEDERIKLPT
jgi:RNA-binding protein